MSRVTPVRGFVTAGDQGHGSRLRITAAPDVTVDERLDPGPSGVVPAEAAMSGAGRRGADHAAPDLGAVRVSCRAALRRLDNWTLDTLNSPAGGGRPR
jgi:hypothetical protein